ncbi:uncharacterized protein EDB93DRAFT_1155505 [Suillus bovinus]|uniref:uncharacterized protein n=1 Tax=Suillus bovinus TaxID=48563 RepID=UPI001B85CD10|nr:uncharacterized protein EDB93DRAFT_1155505 [Suillus bovinus]KAG2143531.1 hypothetical protein EDB93DRAFT_1155505 [Suillus bovinus]
MGCCASLFRKPQRQTPIIENGNGSSVDNAATSADSATRPLTIPAVPVSVPYIANTHPYAPIQPSAPQAQVQLDPSIPVDDNLGPGAQLVAFDTDPFAIPSTSIRKQSDHPTSSGGLGDVWRCSRTIDPATSTEVAVKIIRITDIRNEKAVQKAKQVYQHLFIM